MGVTYSQFFPPRPTFTEANLPSLQGKVFIVTGGASGIGYQLASILYHAGGRVYIAGRSEANARYSISNIKAASTASLSTAGELEFLHLELDDLSTIKATVAAFTAEESRLDVLFNNAGVSLPPAGSLSKQNHELQLATNCLGPCLLTQLLLPTLSATAAQSTQAAVRVVWTSSQMVDLAAIKGGLNVARLTTDDQAQNYTVTKVGNWFLASELAKQVGPKGILSVSQNPGNLKTNLLRSAPVFMRWVSAPLLYEARMGAYTELWAGLSDELWAGFSEEMKMVRGGAYILPWGRIHLSPRSDLLDALKSVENGGTGRAQEFAEWCEKQVAQYR